MQNALKKIKKMLDNRVTLYYNIITVRIELTSITKGVTHMSIHEWITSICAIITAITAIISVVIDKRKK